MIFVVSVVGTPWLIPQHPFTQIIRQSQWVMLIPFHFLGIGLGRCELFRVNETTGEKVMASGKGQSATPPLSFHLAGCEQGCGLCQVLLAAVLRP